jgi:3-oxoacyl-[acyl-carrier-protein] synthase-3
MLEPSEEPGYGIVDSLVHTDGKGGKYLHMLAGGSLNPPSYYR